MIQHAGMGLADGEPPHRVRFELGRSSGPLSRCAAALGLVARGAPRHRADRGDKQARQQQHSRPAFPFWLGRRG